MNILKKIDYALFLVWMGWKDRFYYSFQDWRAIVLKVKDPTERYFYNDGREITDLEEIDRRRKHIFWYMLGRL